MKRKNMLPYLKARLRRLHFNIDNGTITDRQQVRILQINTQISRLMKG